ISEEFNRITSKDLLGTFDIRHCVSPKDSSTERPAEMTQPSFFWSVWTLTMKNDCSEVCLAILTVIEDDDAAISPNVRDVAVVWEGTIPIVSQWKEESDLSFLPASPRL
ncbi:hypothetical protein JOQ06_016530, partial [Pogonophryne albipinna]